MHNRNNDRNLSKLRKNCDINYGNHQSKQIPNKILNIFTEDEQHLIGCFAFCNKMSLGKSLYALIDAISIKIVALSAKFSFQSYSKSEISFKKIVEQILMIQTGQQKKLKVHQ